MRIAIVVNDPRAVLPPRADDAIAIPIWAYEVAKRVARSDEVIVYTSGGRLPEEEWYEGVKYRRLSGEDWLEKKIEQIQQMRGGWRATKSLPGRLHDFRSGLFYFGYSFGVAKDVRRQNCDVVHIMEQSQFTQVVKALNPGIRVVVHLHNEWPMRLDPRVAERRLKRADRIISCSGFVTNSIRKLFPRLANRCATVFEGVDPKLFAPREHQSAGPERVKRILSVGRISPEKGLHVLLDAFAYVAERCPEARLEIVGPAVGYEMPLDVLKLICTPGEGNRLQRFYDGRPYRSHLDEQIRSLGLEDRVGFTAPPPRPELAERYRSAHVFAFPSVNNEGFGMVAAEAMSSGVPVVAARIGGIPEVVAHGKTGILVEPNDPEAFAEGLIRLLKDDNLRHSMGRAARQRAAELFSWDKTAHDILEVYRTLESQHNRIWSNMFHSLSRRPRVSDPCSHTPSKQS
jgi:glycosyltransferase involved in cell wall biosynthesis